MKKRVFIVILLSLLINMVSAKNNKFEKATFGAGCFWGVEDAFMQIEGVMKTTAGYLGGTMKHPTYKDICYNNTGHAEVVEIVFDPEIVSYESLLSLFWGIHNPTLLNRQGPDVGTQYRSAIFYHSVEQKLIAERSKSELEASQKFQRAIVTEISEASTFYKAEEYHQEYLKKNGLSSCHI